MSLLFQGASGHALELETDPLLEQGAGRQAGEPPLPREHPLLLNLQRSRASHC